MKTASKLLIIDKDGCYLALYLAAHPRYSDSADLPGGTVDAGENPLQGMLREVAEEIGVAIEPTDVTELYAGTEYSKHDTNYVLYRIRVAKRPRVTLSWEHSSYEWLSRDDFLKNAEDSLDTYMHMVADILKKETHV